MPSLRDGDADLAHGRLRRQATQVTVALLAVVAGGAFYQQRHHQNRVTTTRAAAVAAHRDTVQPAPNDFLRSYVFSRTQDDRLQLDFDLDGAKPFVLPSIRLGVLAEEPAGGAPVRAS